MKKTKDTTLDSLKVGEDAIVTAIKCEDPALRKHILDMGLTPNVEVTLVKTAPMGDPLEIRLRGYELTIRKSDAQNIIIADIHDTDILPRANKQFKDIEHSQIGETKNYPTRKLKNFNKKTVLKLALAGNQNSGKTTLFNKLTGSNQHVGNFPGVTVDRTDGVIKGHKNVTITDLPGIYSLSPYSNEEVVTRNFILSEMPDGIINIIDATNIERNLFLTMQLIELDIPMVIALNMMDEVEEAGGSIDVNGLEATLGVPVIPISASKNQGIDELVEHIINVAQYNEHPGRLDFCNPNIEDEKSVHKCIHSIIPLIEDNAKSANIPLRFAATKITEGDHLIIDALNLDKSDEKTIKQIINDMEKDMGMDRQAALANARFSFIERLCNNFVQKNEESPAGKFSLKLDKILTGKYTAFIAFFLIMGLIFYLTFGPVGDFLSDLMGDIIDYITNVVDVGLTHYGLNKVVHSLIIDGVFAGVGSVLSFLPIIVVLFFFLSILEDTGYMARVAFVMDKILRKIGLSGRSFVPMLIGFGCSVPAIMATRTLPSERDRKMTIFLTPFMSCSAKLPIYVLFTVAFFKRNQLEVIVGLYLIGIIVGIIFAFILKLFVFKGEPVPFVMELPNYRFPSAANVWRLIVSRSKDFITKAFTIIFWATIIVWFLGNFDIRLNLVTNPANSMLAMLGSFIVPLFKPLGITDWRITTAFLTGFMAKESVVSTLTILLGDVSKLPAVFTQLTAFVFLVFSLLYTPCVAAIAMVKRELGKGYAMLVVLTQCTIAWIVAFLVYQIGKCLGS
ncbi:MAG: ferrous iron transport protein B [Cyanobacteriota bacterium]|nr:ferrous iron transport protein B [Cyanobacteriota bacterium]